MNLDGQHEDYDRVRSVLFGISLISYMCSCWCCWVSAALFGSSGFYLLALKAVLCSSQTNLNGINQNVTLRKELWLRDYQRTMGPQTQHPHYHQLATFKCKL